MYRLSFLVMFTLSLQIGCDQPQTSSSGPSPSAGGPPPPPPGATSLQAPPSPPEPAPQGGGVGGSTEGQFQNEGGQFDREVAQVGVGKKGQNYGGGMISEPVRQYFRAQEQITFLTIHKNLRTFKALKNRLPQSHEEFMKEIVEAGGLSLPELPAGARYRYDPTRGDLGELMVERPK